jgi:Domain of unknown function (DUF4157)
MEYKDSFNYDESDEQQRKRQQYNPNDPYGLGAASPGDPYGLSSAPQDDPYSLQPREAAPDLGPKAKRKEPTDDSQNKKDKAQTDPSKADTRKPEDTAEALFGVSTPELEKQVGKATDIQESQADELAKQVASEPTSDGQQKPAKAETPPSNPTAAPNLPGLPTTGGKKLSKEDQQKFGKKVGDLSDVEIHNAPKAAKYLDAEAFTVGRRIYKGKNANKDTISHEIAHFSPNDKTTGKLRRRSASDSWAEREKQRQIEERKAAERRRIAAEKEAAEKKRAALAKAAEERRVAAVKVEAARRHAEQLASKQNPQSTDRTQPHTQKIGGLKGLEAKALKYQEQEKQAKLAKQAKQPSQLKGLKALEAKALKYQEQEKQAKLQKKLQTNLKQQPGLQNILKQSSFFGGALALGAGVLSPALGMAAVAGARKGLHSEPEKKKEGGSWWDKAKRFGSQAASGVADVGQKILKNGSSAIADVVKTVPQPLMAAANPAMVAAAVIPGAAAMMASPKPEATPKPEEKKEGGSWWDKAKRFGGSMVDKAKDAGKAAIDGATDFGKSVANTAGNAWNGASKWVSDHKAEIAIGVGVVALAAATIVTGGAALAVAGAVAGGAAVSAGTVATVAAGGFVAGAGLNLVQQGTQIKDGRIDPATGKKKTDLNFGEVAKTGAFGAVAAPLGAAAFGLAPVLVGGAGIVGAGASGINAYNNFTGNNFLTNNNPEKTKNPWSGAFDVGNTAMALLPFASKGGRNAMFGAEARARTVQTAGQVWNGTKSLGVQALSGAKNLSAQGLGGVKDWGAQALNGAKNWSGQALNGARNWGTQGLTNAKNWGTERLSSAKDWGAQAWNGSRNWGAQAWNDTKHLGNQALVGAKNWGNRALNAADELGYRASNWFGDNFGPPPGSFGELVPVGVGGGRVPPTRRPMLPMPEKQKPLMMQGNNPEGGVPQSNKPGASAKTSTSVNKVNEWKENNQITGDLKDLQKRLNSPDRGNRLGAEAEVRAYEQRIKNGEVPEVQGNKAGTDFAGNEIKARTEPFTNEKQANNFFADRIKKANSQYAKQGSTGAVTIDLGTQGTIDGKVMTKDVVQRLVQQALSKGNRGSEITEVVVIDGSGNVIYTGKGD